MVKQYKAGSHVCLSVGLQDGGSARVSFTPLSGGGSIYSTGDEGLQWGLEHHRKYGKLFVLAGEAQSAEEEEAGAAEEAAGADEPETVKLSDWDTAKDYVSERYGVSRTRLRTRKQIEQAAAAYGLKLDIEE